MVKNWNWVSCGTSILLYENDTGGKMCCSFEMILIEKGVNYSKLIGVSMQMGGQ